MKKYTIQELIKEIEHWTEIKLTNKMSDDCLHYIYEDKDADGNSVYVSTYDKNIVTEEEMFCIDSNLYSKERGYENAESEIETSLEQALWDNEGETGNIYVSMLYDGADWLYSCLNEHIHTREEDCRENGFEPGE